MANNVGGLGGGAGSIQPQHQIDVDVHDEAVENAVDVEARVNVLPSSVDLEGVSDLDSVGGSIPRDNAHVQGEQDALHRTVHPDGPDEAAALGGSTLTGAIQSAEGQEDAIGGVVHASANGYQTQVNPDGALNVTGPGGVQHQGRIEDGVVTLDFQETDTHPPVQATFRGPPEDAELTVQVDALDGSDPRDITIDVQDTTDASDRLRTERDEDEDKNPEWKPELKDWLEAFNTIVGILERWIESHMGAGKPGI